MDTKLSREYHYQIEYYDRKSFNGKLNINKPFPITYYCRKIPNIKITLDVSSGVLKCSSSCILNVIHRRVK